MIVALISLGATNLLLLGLCFYLIRVMQAERRYLLNYAMADNAFELMGMEKVMGPQAKPAKKPEGFQPPSNPLGM